MNEPHAIAPDPARAVAETMQRIYDRRLTTTSGGNLSVRDDDGAIWITPGGVDKGELRQRDIVRVRTDGSTDGAHAPSSEWPFHAAIYRTRPDLRAIVHAHPTALVAFSICHKAPDTSVLASSRAICGPVGHVPYERSGSDALAERVAGAFADGFDCLMLANHGVVTAGADMPQAYQRFETLEHTAQILARANLIGAPQPLTKDRIQRLASPRDPAQPASPAPASALLEDLRRFVRRGYAQRLMTCAAGAISGRVDDGSFLINAAHLDRARPNDRDFSLVKLAGPPPDAPGGLHAAVYRRHPSVNAVISAAPVNAAAFCVTGEHLNTHAMAEAYVLLRDVASIPFDTAHEEPDVAAELVSPQRPAALIGNVGAFVLGASLLEAFDRLEVLEATAATLIDGGGLGGVSPLDEDEIAALADLSYAPRDRDKNN